MRTSIKDHLADRDLVLIAKEMVNIYHGVEYWNIRTGQLETTPDKNFMKWEIETVGYEYIPCRGFIYINSSDYSASNIIRKKLLQAFNLYNRWGWRETTFVSHIHGSNQFTLEECEDHPGDEMAIVEINSNAFANKNIKGKFIWTISQDSRLMQYSITGKYPKPYLLISAMTTIVVDVKHSINLTPGDRWYSYPPLAKDITIVKRGIPILLSVMLGIDGHVYEQLGGDHGNLRFGKFRVLNSTITIVAVGEPQIEVNVAKISAVEDLKSLGTNVPTEEKCAVCKILIFGEFYIVSHDEMACRICKFCAHFNPKINTELNSGTWTVARTRSATSVESLIEILNFEPIEKNLLRDVQKSIKQLDMRLLSIKDAFGEEFIFFKGADQVTVLMIGNSEFVGVSGLSVFSNELMDQIHLVPDKTRLFHYRLTWS